MVKKTLMVVTVGHQDEHTQSHAPDLLSRNLPIERFLSATRIHKRIQNDKIIYMSENTNDQH